MAFTFVDLQNEVKRRSTRDQGGTQFDTAIKNIINTSLFRLAREAAWRVLRRKTTFDTVKAYSTGSGSGTFTSGSNLITVTGANFYTDSVEVGRRIKLQNEGNFFTVTQFPSNTTALVDREFSATTITSTGTYSILGQEQYTLPVQSGHRMFLWHEGYGFPFRLQYITDQDFYERGIINTTQAIPTHYRMWGEDMAITQVTSATNISLSSTNAADTAVDVTVFGNVAGFPDFEKITTNAGNGTTTVTGSKLFTSIERVSKDASTTGMIVVSDVTAARNVAVLPVGDTTAGILYKKIQLYPLPDKVFPINAQYYKDPYRLVDDDDIHEMGQQFDEALILLSVAKIQYQTQQKEGDRFLGLYKDEVKNLRRTNVDKIDFFPSLRRPHDSGFQDAFVHPNLLFRQAGAFFGPARRR